MKTQINHLRSGAKNQVLNNVVDYSLLPRATSHVGHSGTNRIDRGGVWAKVYEENKTHISITLFGQTIVLKANWSISGKSVTYHSRVPNSFLTHFAIVPSKNETSSISISGESIMVSNGKNSYTTVCPSLITIN
jgi:hypothetical protein